MSIRHLSKVDSRRYRKLGDKNNYTVWQLVEEYLRMTIAAITFHVFPSCDVCLDRCLW